VAPDGIGPLLMLVMSCIDAIVRLRGGCVKECGDYRKQQIGSFTKLHIFRSGNSGEL
jgi:hypothetical protein